MKKLGHREVKLLYQGHTVKNRKSSNINHVIYFQSFPFTLYVTLERDQSFDTIKLPFRMLIFKLIIKKQKPRNNM